MSQLNYITKWVWSLPNILCPEVCSGKWKYYIPPPSPLPSPPHPPPVEICFTCYPPLPSSSTLLLPLLLLQDVPYLAITGFLFLRFFVPAILAPKLFSVKDEHPDQKTERTLKLIAKVGGCGVLDSLLDGARVVSRKSYLFFYFSLSGASEHW